MTNELSLFYMGRSHCQDGHSYGKGDVSAIEVVCGVMISLQCKDMPRMLCGERGWIPINLKRITICRRRLEAGTWFLTKALVLVFLLDTLSIALARGQGKRVSEL